MNRQPWWEDRIEYLLARGRREQAEAEGLYALRAQAAVARRRWLERKSGGSSICEGGDSRENQSRPLDRRR